MREIYNDWKIALPMLKKIKSNTLFEVLGPLLVGIEFEKSRFTDNYKTYLSVSGLWGSDVSNFKGKLSDSDAIFYPEIYFPLNNSSFMGNTYFTNFEEHKVLFSNMIADLKLQFLPLGENVHEHTLIKFIDWYRTNKDLRKSGSELDAQVLEFKYILALYISDNNLINEVQNEIISEKDFWHKDGFKLRFGEYDEWIKKIKNLERSDLLNSIKRVSNNLKIKKLNTFELIK